MIENIDQLIELNLKIISESKLQSIWKFELQDINNKTLYDSERLALIMEEKGLVVIKNESCKLNEFGFNIYQNGGWLEYLSKKQNTDLESEKFLKEKNELEFEKTKIDIELSKKILKEFPKTKLIARISLLIGIILLLLEIIKSINK